MAGFCMDLFRDENYNLDEAQLDKETIALIKSVLKIENINYLDKSTESENLRSMFIAIAKDIRVIIVKLADVLYSARNYKTNAKELNKNFPKPKQKVRPGLQEKQAKKAQNLFPD